MGAKVRTLKAQLPVALVRRAEHAKVDLSLTWSQLIAAALAKFLGGEADDGAMPAPGIDATSKKGE
jgi:hypothetical protein